MTLYNALWAVVEEIEAPSAEAALGDLRARLRAAGFEPYDGTYDLVPDDYELAYVSENDQGGESEPH